jgi:mRNA deadenylase 3'-5' endonuclease subunit Ccr4
LYISITH